MLVFTDGRRGERGRRVMAAQTVRLGASLSTIAHDLPLIGSVIGAPTKHDRPTEPLVRPVLYALWPISGASNRRSRLSTWRPHANSALDLIGEIGR